MTIKATNFHPLIYSLLFISMLATLVHCLRVRGYGLTYMVSPSMPAGFYSLVPPQNLQRYDIVQFQPPPATVKFLAAKHWGAPHGILLKYIYGMPNDVVCNRGGSVSVNGQNIAPVFYEYYAHERRYKLPRQDFCGRLLKDQYLLLSTKLPNSFDGRYFGPITQDEILHKAIYWGW